MFILTCGLISKTFASEKIYILAKVNDQIITNLDVKKESNYLIALNNNLESLEKDVVSNLAKNSLIKEIIKNKK